MGRLHKTAIRRHAGHGKIAKARRFTEEQKEHEKKLREKYRRISEFKARALKFSKNRILMYPDWNFGQRCKALRIHQGDRIKDVAVGTVLSTRIIDMLEACDRRPGYETARRLAAYFKVSMKVLTRGLERFKYEELE